MAHFKTQFEIELDAYENYADVHIESLEEKWRVVAKEVLGETEDISRKGIQMLKVSDINITKIGILIYGNVLYLLGQSKKGGYCITLFSRKGIVRDRKTKD